MPIICFDNFLYYFILYFRDLKNFNLPVFVPLTSQYAIERWSFVDRQELERTSDNLHVILKTPEQQSYSQTVNQRNAINVLKEAGVSEKEIALLQHKSLRLFLNEQSPLSMLSVARRSAVISDVEFFEEKEVTSSTPSSTIMKRSSIFFFRC